jgi:hypothetical protein
MVYQQRFGGTTRFRNIYATGIISGALAGDNTNKKIVYVDGTNGSNTTMDGTSWACPLATIQAGVTAAGRGGTVFVVAKEMTAGATDPSSYAENVVIPATHSGLKLVGLSKGRTQGGLPQLKVGATTTQALITIRAPGCMIANMGVNGNGGTGGGILLDDDSSTKTAFGTSIYDCHFKNCVGTTATNAATGGAIMWSSAGGAWQLHIAGCRFYKNVGDIVDIGTGTSVPQDVVIEDCIFSGPAASVHINILAAGSGVDGLIIRNCVFGQLPSLGTAPRYMNLATGTVGMISGCTFGCQTSQTGTPITFKANGTGAIIPTTVHIAGCYGQSITADKSGEICIA